MMPRKYEEIKVQLKDLTDDELDKLIDDIEDLLAHGR